MTVPFPEIGPGIWAAALASAACLGFSKAGFTGAAMVNVLVMAELFGAKTSVGIILPLLIFCDVTVYPMFRRYATWRDTLPILVPTLAGVIVGTVLLDRIDALTAKQALAGIILFMLGLQLLREARGTFLSSWRNSRPFEIGSGLVMGVSTMMANAAGPAYSIYALVRGYTKNEFLGVGARAFLLINLFKVPFMAGLDMITPATLALDLTLVPGLLGGIFLGKKLIDRVPQRLFEILLYAFTAAAGLKLLLEGFFVANGTPVR